jgi:hypothetical protein
MPKAETEIPLSPRAREALEKYRQPCVVRRDGTPQIEKSFLSKHPKWIDRAGWEGGCFPIYTITDEGLLALEVDQLLKRLRDRNEVIPEEFYAVRPLTEKLEILKAAATGCIALRQR